MGSSATTSNATPAARTPPSASPANRATSRGCARIVIASIENARTAAAANSSTAILPRGPPRDPDDSRPPVPTPLRAGPVHRQPFRQGSTQHHHDPVPAVDCHTSVPGAACLAADRRHPRKPCRLSPPLSPPPFRAIPLETDGAQQTGTEAIYLAPAPGTFPSTPSLP